MRMMVGMIFQPRILLGHESARSSQNMGTKKYIPSLRKRWVASDERAILSQLRGGVRWVGLVPSSWPQPCLEDAIARVVDRYVRTYPAVAILFTVEIYVPKLNIRRARS